MMDICITNIILYCKRWEKCIEFYSDELNLPVLFQKAWFVEYKLTKRAHLSIADSAQSSIKSSGGIGLTISLQVQDIQSEHIRFQKKNLNPTPIHPIWGSKAFYLFDPEGNRIEFWS